MKIPGAPRSLWFCVAAVMIVHISGATAEPGRHEIDLSGENWRLWLDRSAEWKNDTAFLPPVDIGKLPSNLPSCGWDRLTDMGDSRRVCVPGTVEEYFWSANGNPNGTAGDYRGVSWWSTTCMVPRSFEGKRLTLAFDSVNLRAEIFVNRKLVGYDVIGNTPFEIDVTGAMIPGSENRLDIRITDPVGTFSWDDENMLRWGPNKVPSVHGFGGITGKIVLRATGDTFIDDIYIQNKPDPRKADAFITINNVSVHEGTGKLTLVIHECKNSSNVLMKMTSPVAIPPGKKTVKFTIDAPKARLWNIFDPYLYTAVATYTSEDGSVSDSAGQRFGFRFFTVGGKNGDSRFYLNGKRVFVFAAMTRGFWPKNGIFPTPEMAGRDMRAARELGFNMMLYHRAIGQPYSIDAADETGMLTYEEPGGYLCQPMPDETAQMWRKEKLRRMIIRDRSRPSMVIFNMDDWSFRHPTEWDMENMRMVHELDPSRIVTFNCISAPEVPYDRDNPMKLHMLPYDDTPRYAGWLDPYHFTAQPGYIDDYYENPRYYLRYIFDPDNHTMGDSLDVVPHDEIIFYGEEGGLNAPIRLEKVRNDLMRTGADGWREREHLSWYETYDRYLDESGMRTCFPTVDDLTTALAANMHYFHGRILENVRIMNTADAYVLNGWASAMTHTDIADTYRNPTADPSLLSYYAQPLYIAVKIRDKVLTAGSVPIADIFIVNEKNLTGNHTLTIRFIDPGGTELFTRKYPVAVRGGEEYGQLLVEDVRLPAVANSGYHTLKAELTDNRGNVKAAGADEIFAVDYLHGPGLRGTIAVVDTSGVIASFVKQSRGTVLTEFDPSGPEPDFLVIGRHDYRTVRRMGVVPGTRSTWPVMDMVANGTTLIILDQAETWAQDMAQYYHKSLRYYSPFQWTMASGMFAGKSPLLEGLPQGRSLNWEYQVMYRNGTSGIRLDPEGIDIVIGTAAFDTDVFGTALCRVPYGTGQVILTTLPILGELLSETPQSSVAKKLFLNLLEYSAGN